MSSLEEKYIKEIIPALKDKFGYQSNLAVPRIIKVTVNAGINRARSEKDGQYAEMVSDNIAEITGQRPVKNLAKKSIAGFKIREGLVVGVSTVLRSHKMYDFLTKLINVTLPRIRDFRGIPAKSIDSRGNLSIGLKEQIMFPEISPEKSERIHGLQIVITTNAPNKEQGKELFKLMGFPIKD
jgi:large subunit ribosomal protein L5